MKKVITFNIWNFLEADDINDILDDTLRDEKIEGMATDIDFEVSKIDKQGNISVKCNFELEEDDYNE